MTSSLSQAAPLNPSDLFYALLDLSELMQATYDIVHDMDFVRPDGTRNEDLDRVASLQRIACRDVKRLRDASEAFAGPAKWLPVGALEAAHD
ncbi:hypothetical protein [Sinorhizobium meliloti]|uniref:Uncharacterized protein n=1 Tax=Rhizobium meliloti TaxID=382 RepID=A0AAW9TVN9_RHIML|nr:hypothetical protein [Sinorhizobium meliloti]MCM5689541.1 hypothetical protein [Sinorhizobium meliloti]MQW35055.1 hypothetical protein [Sinorhizobium meliloti]RVL87480.1 hypothetical protein CN140_02680 [Sinorhizobium meliloti]WQP08349.1 hypothetical protein U8C39_22485 [Sinorhizobium meliloti]WQP21767.1 hypothetical protein U8C33_22620 [Sinorhizobium meliloti]